MVSVEFVNGHTYNEANSIPHTPEKNLPGGGNWVVQKFGGTSVGKFPLNIAGIVQAGLVDNRIAVVCSARSNNTKAEGTTNRILRALREADDAKWPAIVEAIREDHVSQAKNTIQSVAISEVLQRALNYECTELAEDLKATRRIGAGSYAENKLIGVGEKLACLFMAAVLEDNGIPAEYVDLSEVISRDSVAELDEHFYAHVAQEFASRVVQCGDKVPVITGYFGNVPAGGLLKAIGRGYTDFCAALVAVGLSAAELQIWKEVDGIFTADPRKVPNARRLSVASPAEAAELTFYGSEVIHPFTMEQVIRARIPIRIKNVKNPRIKGTVIYPDPIEEPRPTGSNHDAQFFRSRPQSDMGCDNVHPKRPTAVTVKRNMVVLNVHSNKRIRAHGFLMSVFAILDKWHLSIDIISSSEVQLSLALHSEAAMISGSVGEEKMRITDDSLRGAVQDLSKIGAIDLVPHMAIVSLIGKELNNMVGIAGKFFSVLGDNNINIQMISQGASEITIGCVIQERDADRALSVLHTSLFTWLD